MSTLKGLRGRVMVGRAVPSAPTLDYGHSISFGGATCTSMRNGLRCSNRQGRGYFLSRQHSYLF